MWYNVVVYVLENSCLKYVLNGLLPFSSRGIPHLNDNFVIRFLAHLSLKSGPFIDWGGGGGVKHTLINHFLRFFLENAYNGSKIGLIIVQDNKMSITGPIKD